MRLTHSAVKQVRDARWIKAGKRCELCGDPLPQASAVLDHCHKMGWVRGSICRGCNSLLGKLENNAPRFGVKDIIKWAYGAAKYLERNQVFHSGLYHPKHMTEDEKRLKRNEKARSKRATAKVTKKA